jgi:hypothetical protein
MKMKWVFLLIALFALQCASSTGKEGTENDSSLMNDIIEKAQSEEGQKAIQAAKEKIQDKETQDKVKSLVF